MRVLIVDDEPAARQRLALMLEELDIEVVGEADNGLAALELIRERKPDVVLLDVVMPEVDGLDVARHLAEPRPLLIFQTAHDQHALEAFEHEALDYILKPVTASRLAQALERAQRRLAPTGAPSFALGEDTLRRLQAVLRQAPAGHPHRILVRHASGHRLLPLRDILRFFADEDEIQVQVPGARYLSDYTLAELEEKTQGRFVRASRSDLVNLDHIERIQSDGDGSATLTLSDGSLVHVSRRRAAEVKRALET
jgi:DNA-binding LytR/AlgR family response regulator